MMLLYDVINIISPRELLVLEVKLVELVTQVVLVTQGHLVLMDLRDLKVTLDPEGQLELKASLDQQEKMLVVIVTVK